MSETDWYCSAVEVLMLCLCVCTNVCVWSVCSGLVQWIRGAAAVTKPIRANSSTCLLISPACLLTCTLTVIKVMHFKLVVSSGQAIGRC